jgi:hypothetical protein
VSIALNTPAVRTQLDLRTIELRRHDLQNFKNFIEVQRFRAEARNGTVAPPSLPATMVVWPRGVTPTDPSRMTSREFVQCDLHGKPSRAWSLGTLGSVDHDVHAAYGKHSAADSHELYVTERGDIVSLVAELRHEGKIVVNEAGVWPIKALMPFDISQLCDCSIYAALERIESLIR